MSSHKLFGSLKVLIAYADTAWATALMRVSFPPVENILCWQLKILLKTFNLISLKKAVFFLPIMEGRSRYFSCLDTTFSLKMSLIAEIWPFGIFPLKHYLIWRTLFEESFGTFNLTLYYFLSHYSWKERSVIIVVILVEEKISFYFYLKSFWKVSYFFYSSICHIYK